MNQHLPQPTQQSLGSDPRTITMICYGLYAASLVVGITLLVGVILAYVKRQDFAGSLYYAHLCYLIKTFWWSMIGFVVGGFTLVFGIGAIILLLASVWFVYRVVAGFIKLYDGKAVDPAGFL